MNTNPHWQLYKKLEFLPESIPDPPATSDVFTFPLRQAWKVLINMLTHELIYEQQVEFLERCLKQDLLTLDQSRNAWHKFLKLLD